MILQALILTGVLAGTPIHITVRYEPVASCQEMGQQIARQWEDSKQLTEVKYKCETIGGDNDSP